MLMTLDHWLARFFGAGRREYSERNSRAAPMAQRAAFGNDGMELRQVGGLYDSFDDEAEQVRPPYAPYLRRPRAVRTGASGDFAPEAAPRMDFQPQAPVDPDEQAFREILATQRSRDILRDLAARSAPQQSSPRFRAETIATEVENLPSPHFWRVDQPQVRFTRTPESSIARRRAEEAARRRAEEEARIKAEEEARLAAETRLAQAHSMNAEASRVRYARTPDRLRAARNGNHEAHHEAQVESTPPENPATPQFGAFAAMGARFSFHFGGLAEPTARRPAPARQEPAPTMPAPVEKAEKIRVRVKAGASPAQQSPNAAPLAAPSAAVPLPAAKPAAMRERIAAAPVAVAEHYEPLEVEMLIEPPVTQNPAEPDDQLEINSDVLEKTLEDFGVRGDILNAHPGPVVTLYEFEPAPGIKSSRVIGLADDIARSMSAISARVAV
ncbi:MAG: DNA translocase FtsK, partial [Rhodoblastus sp.]|uniref:DNA translocase FtsK n=2 Tax=Rhodoblastus sp. TaxID=1962975 RepID=UPI003F945D87